MPGLCPRPRVSIWTYHRALQVRALRQDVEAVPVCVRDDLRRGRGPSAADHHQPCRYGRARPPTQPGRCRGKAAGPGALGAVQAVPGVRREDAGDVDPRQGPIPRLHGLPVPIQDAESGCGVELNRSEEDCHQDLFLAPSPLDLLIRIASRPPRQYDRTRPRPRAVTASRGRSLPQKELDPGHQASIRPTMVYLSCWAGAEGSAGASVNVLPAPELTLRAIPFSVPL